MREGINLLKSWKVEKEEKEEKHDACFSFSREMQFENGLSRAGDVINKLLRLNFAWTSSWTGVWMNSLSCPYILVARNELLVSFRVRTVLHSLRKLIWSKKMFFLKLAMRKAVILVLLPSLTTSFMFQPGTHSSRNTFQQKKGHRHEPVVENHSHWRLYGAREDEIRRKVSMIWKIDISFVLPPRYWIRIVLSHKTFSLSFRS